MCRICLTAASFFRSKNKFNDEGELEQQIDMFRWWKLYWQVNECNFKFDVTFIFSPVCTVDTVENNVEVEIVVGYMP